MSKEKNSHKVLQYIAPSLLAGAVFVLILAINGLWPFGKETIDYYDMAQWADLYHYQNYDEIRGLKSFLFDWYLNLGRPIPGLNHPSVFNLLLFLFSRKAMLTAASFMMFADIMAAAFTMNIFLRSENEDLPYVYRLILSAGYAFCGFMIVNYTIPQWLDMAVLVPLLLLYAKKSLKTGKAAGLSVTVFLLMIDDYYFAIQALMFVFLIGGAFVLIERSGRSKKNENGCLSVFGLAAGVLTGIAMSAFSWLPNIRYAIMSSRFEKGSGEGLIGSYFDILKTTDPAYLSRWFSLLGLAFCSALAAKGIIGVIRDRNFGKIIFSLLCVFAVASQLLLESIHLMLHFGSYVNYPVRNGYMIYCVVAAIAANTYRARDDRYVPDCRKNRILLALFFVLSAAGVTVFTFLYKNITGLTDHDVFLMTMSIMAVMFVLDFVMIYAGARSSCVCIWCAEALIFGIIMIGKPAFSSPYGNDPEQEGEYIRITDQLTEGLSDVLKTGEDAATLRIKNPDTSLNSNYGIVMRRETLSGWTNLETEDQINGAVNLGYSSQLTRLLDSGGNIFSDVILHITDAVSHHELDDNLYEKVTEINVESDYLTGQKEKYYYYRNRYEIPFAIPVRSIPESPEKSDKVGVFNNFAYAMGSDNPIATMVEEDPKLTEKNGHRISDHKIDVKGRKTLYFKGGCVDTDYYNTRIYVNEKPVKIPSIKENDNELFPAHFNNNTVELGSFENETVNITIDMDISDKSHIYRYYIYGIDRDVLEDICEDLSGTTSIVQGRRSLDIRLDNVGEECKGILIPVSYDDGWRAWVDGKNSLIQNVYGLFMYIPADNNCKRVYLSYFPKLMWQGIICSIIGCICLFAYEKKRKVIGAGVDKILSYIYIAAFALASAVIYVIPVIFAIVAKIVG